MARITFTGSTVNGRSLMGACAETGPKPVTLELGGKSPQLVFGDIADIDRTAATLAAAVTGNAGQVCVAGSRLLIERSLFEPMIERLRAHFDGLAPGLTWQEGTRFSPIISETQTKRIESVIGRAIGAGAELVSGGTHFETPFGGCFYQLTILQVNGRDNPAVHEEIFGPVLSVQAFDDEEEALEFGMVGLNTGAISMEVAPFGGVKQSSLGREGARQGLDEYFEEKAFHMGGLS